MNIVWHGQSCFQISSGSSKDQVNIIIDPYDESIGFKPPRLEGDIVLVTHNHYDHNNVKAVSGNPFVIDGPGEYEIKGVFVEGIPAYHDSESGKERGQNTIYTIETEDIKLCHLGDLGQKELTAEQVEQIGDIDILMIPVGGNFTISAKEAVKVMSQIEPGITIPMHYDLPKIKVKIDGVDVFLKAMGVKSIEPVAKFSIKKKDIPEEEAKIVVLKP